MGKCGNVSKNRRRGGFTLTELLMVSVISTIVIGGVSAALVQSLRAWRAAGVRAELHMDLERSMERMRHDLRLSSVGIGLMAFYPEDAAAYTAISFPLATPDADGLLPRDGAGNIIWDTTIIYHVRPGSPDELIRSRFHPRNPDASPSDIYDQLVKVVHSGNIQAIQDAAMPGERGSSEIIFRNLVNLVFRPPEMRFDGYAPEYERARTINWGSIVLGKGVHELTFTVERKNAASNGYKLGLDRFALSYSGSPREAEWFLPEHSRPSAPYYRARTSGGSMIAEDMSSHGASWSGLSQLTYTPNFEVAGEAGSKISFEVHNDIWNDTTFDNPPGEDAWNCKRTVDRSFATQSPFIPDIVIAMEEGLSWEAENVTDVAPESMTVSHGTTANVLHGGTSEPASILMNGSYARFSFSAGSNHNLHVRNLVFGEKGSGGTIVPGTEQSVGFYGGFSYALVHSGMSLWTDWIRYEIDQDTSYVMQWDRRNILNQPPTDQTDARVWNVADGSIQSYLDGIPTSQIVALTAMEVRAPSNAMYRSGVFDTRVASPSYTRLSWTQVEHGANGSIGMQVRSSDYPDMRDADWYPSGFHLTNNGNSNISAINGGRFVQYQAHFSVAGTHTQLPVLRDVTLAWEAPTGIVDLVVDLARGPDYGIITADVNGQSFIRGVEIDLEIFREGPFGFENMAGSTEVRPLNTGR